MKPDLRSLALRGVAAWFLWTLAVVFFFLAGTAQRFLDTTLESLQALARASSWGGFVVSFLVLLPLLWGRRRRVWATLALGLAFGTIGLALAFWGAWVLPGGAG